MINFIDALTYDKEIEQPAGKGCGINLININAQRRSRELGVGNWRQAAWLDNKQGHVIL